MPPKVDKKKELQKLITTGKEKGFLTYEEINEALPEDITESDELDEVMALIEDADIEVVESEKDVKAAGGAKGKSAAPAAEAASSTAAPAAEKKEEKKDDDVEIKEDEKEKDKKKKKIKKNKAE